MKLLNDDKEPDLLGILDSKKEFGDIVRMVDNINQDLIDSGFNQYKFKAELYRDKAYIRRI